MKSMAEIMMPDWLIRYVSVVDWAAMLFPLAHAGRE
jgi:hypothetical protein